MFIYGYGFVERILSFWWPSVLSQAFVYLKRCGRGLDEQMLPDASRCLPFDLSQIDLTNCSQQGHLKASCFGVLLWCHCIINQ